MSLECCNDRNCWDYRYLTKEEAIDLVTMRVLRLAVENPSGAIITRENCIVENVPMDCFVRCGTWSWGIRSKLYVHSLEEVSGEEARRMINLAKSVAQFDETEAKVLKLTIRRVVMKIRREWEEHDVLYVGDSHFYGEYCIQPSPDEVDEVVAYVVVADDKIIPVSGIEELKKYVW
jgi:hypothetical protein